MSTRGILGFITEGGTEKIAYNHFDSYPDGLGVQVLAWLRARVGDDLLARQVDQLKVIDGDTEPMPDAEEIARLTKYTDRNVGATWSADGGLNHSLNWYQLLRRTQGDPEAMLDAGYLEDSRDFAHNGLFCEWGYLVDLQRGMFQIYRGFSTSPPKAGRWAGRTEPTETSGPRDYYAIDLAVEWPLDALPSEDEFIERLVGDPDVDADCD